MQVVPLVWRKGLINVSIDDVKVFPPCGWFAVTTGRQPADAAGGCLWLGRKGLINVSNDVKVFPPCDWFAATTGRQAADDTG